MLWHVSRASQCFSVHAVLGKPRHPQGKRLPQIIDALIRPETSHDASNMLPVVPEHYTRLKTLCVSLHVNN